MVRVSADGVRLCSWFLAFWDKRDKRFFLFVFLSLFFCSPFFSLLPFLRLNAVRCVMKNAFSFPDVTSRNSSASRSQSLVRNRPRKSLYFYTVKVKFLGAGEVGLCSRHDLFPRRNHDLFMRMGCAY